MEKELGEELVEVFVLVTSMGISMFWKFVVRKYYFIGMKAIFAFEKTIQEITNLPNNMNTINVHTNYLK